MKIRMTLIAVIAVISVMSIPAYAHCPLCTAATGMAVATARFYGVSDLIIGTFIGAFILSTGLWANNLLRKRNKGKNYFVAQMPIIVIASFATTLASFYYAGLLGVDELLAGTISGSVVTAFAFWSHRELREIRKSNYFPMQGIVLPLAFVVAFNVMLYLGGYI